MIQYSIFQTQDSKFEPWWSEADRATSRSRRLTFFISFKAQTTEPGNRTPNSSVKGSGANHYPRAPAHSKQTTLTTATEPQAIYCINSLKSKCVFLISNKCVSFIEGQICI